MNGANVSVLVSTYPSEGEEEGAEKIGAGNNWAREEAKKKEKHVEKQ